MANPSPIIPVWRYNKQLIGQGLCSAVAMWLRNNTRITQMFPDFTITTGFHENMQTTTPLSIMVIPRMRGSGDSRWFYGEIKIIVRLNRGAMFDQFAKNIDDAANIIQSEMYFTPSIIYVLRNEVPGLAYLGWKNQAVNLDNAYAKKKDSFEFYIILEYRININEFEFHLQEHSGINLPLETINANLDLNEIPNLQVSKEFNNN